MIAGAFRLFASHPSFYHLSLIKEESPVWLRNLKTYFFWQREVFRTFQKCSDFILLHTKFCEVFCLFSMRKKTYPFVIISLCTFVGSSTDCRRWEGKRKRRRGIKDSWQQVISGAYIQQACWRLEDRREEPTPASLQHSRTLRHMVDNVYRHKCTTTTTASWCDPNCPSPPTSTCSLCARRRTKKVIFFLSRIACV